MKQEEGTIKEVEKSYSVPCLERALLIIELLRNSPDGLISKGLQEGVWHPKSSLFKSTQTLVDRSYLIKSEHPSLFSLSKKYLHIGLSTL